jgi:hypothetical protein
MQYERIPDGLHMDLHNPTAMIVTGSDLYSEGIDRPIAGYLRQRLNAMLSQRVQRDLAISNPGPMVATVPACLVCSDAWHLNDVASRLRPAIAVGSPEHNAFAAFLIARLKTVMAVDGQFAIYADEDFEQPVACVWGVDGLKTAQGVEAFVMKFGERFMERACLEQSGR